MLEEIKDKKSKLELNREEHIKKRLKVIWYKDKEEDIINPKKEINRIQK